MTVLDDLREAGFTEYEAKTYRALVEYGEQTGRQLSELSKVPPTRIFDALRSLREKGLVELIQQKPMVWLATKPETNIKSLMERKSATYLELGKRLELELKHARQEPEKKTFDRVAVRNGLEKTIEETVVGNIKNSVKEVCSYSRGDAFSPYSEIENAKAIRRGVLIRQIGRLYNERNRLSVEKRIKDGLKFRYLPGSDDYSFFIFDRQKCVLVVKDSQNEKDKVVITFENMGLSSALHDYFDSLWDRAKTIDELKSTGFGG